MTAPAVYVSHGAGPMFFIEGSGPFKEIDRTSVPARTFRGIGENPEAHGLPAKPSAIVIVSAHWEAGEVRVLAAPRPGILYDYYGFPQESYEIEYPAPGSPELARRVKELVDAYPGAPKTTLDTSSRGYDHGVFLPLKLLYPGADVPVVQLSLQRDLDPLKHYLLGRALAPLRAEGVLIVGSGQWTHPMATRRGTAASARFDKEMSAIVQDPALSAEERFARVASYFSDPAKKSLTLAAHNPTYEHFAPMFVVLGAGGEGAGVDLFRGKLDSKRLYVLDGAFSLASWVFSGPVPGAAPEVRGEL